MTSEDIAVSEQLMNAFLTRKGNVTENIENPCGLKGKTGHPMAPLPVTHDPHNDFKTRRGKW
jgi:hypothetical protein